MAGAWCAGTALGRESGGLSRGGFPPWASVSLAMNRIFPPGLAAVMVVKRNHSTEAAHTHRKSGERVLGLTLEAASQGKRTHLSLSLSASWRGLPTRARGHGWGASGGSWSGTRGPVRTRALRDVRDHTGPLAPQMMMQYLYHGGTESMDIPTADVLEVSLWGPLLPSRLPCSPGLALSSLRHLPGLNLPLRIWRDEEGKKLACARTSWFPDGPFSV